MFWESIPDWVLGIYYLFLISTLIIGILNFIKDNNRTFSIISILFSITIPFLGIINSIDRIEGFNELEHLFIQLQKGSIWAIYSVIGCLYLLIWLMLYLINSRKIKLISKNSF